MPAPKDTRNVCPRCGTVLSAFSPDALSAHQASTLCTAGAAARDAEGRGLLRPLHFETVLNNTLRTDPDAITQRRVDLMRGAGVEVQVCDTRVTPSPMRKVQRGTGLRVSHTIVAEPWAPAWAVALVYSHAPDDEVSAALRRGVADSDTRAAVQALVAMLMQGALRGQRVDLRGALRAFVQAGAAR